MKNNHGRMIGLSIGFEASADGGGGGGAGAGAAVADPPAGGAAGAGTGSGAGAGAGAGGGAGEERSGFFTNLTKRDLPKPAAETGTEGAAGAGDGAAAKTPEELAEAAALELATAEGKTPEQLAAEAAGGEPATPSEITEDTVLKTPIYGRFKTIKEANSGFQRSERHGIELDAQNKALKTQINQISARHESDMAAARAETELARKTPPFAELTDEQEQSLAKENPLAATKYLLAKEKHADATARAKQDAAHAVEDRQKRMQAVTNEIERDYMEMDADLAKYPLFKQVQPLMDAIHNTLGGDRSPLRGDPRAVRAYYRMALGDMYLSLLRKGHVARTKSLEEAKLKAGAGAAATGGVGAGAGAGGGKKPTPAEEDQKKWSEGIRAAGPKSFLTGWPDEKKA